MVLPYAFDINDMRFFDQPAFVRGADFAAYVSDAIEQLLNEAEQAPRMLTIGLHTRIIGRPARIGGLDAVLRQLRSLGERVWLARRGDIARHWLALPPTCRPRSARASPAWPRTLAAAASMCPKPTTARSSRRRPEGLLTTFLSPDHQG